MKRISRYHPWARWWPLVLSTIAVVLYLGFRSVSLDDFDSYSFALALEQFDLALQQPQPPGFPVYIAVSRLAQRLLDNPIPALTTVSALSGGLAVGLVGLLGQEADESRPFTAAFAALLFGLAPVTWLTSEKALSDAPGLLGTLLALWLWQSWHAHGTQEGTRPLPIVPATTTGIVLGIRPQNALPIALWIGGAMLADILRRRSIRPWLIGAGCGLLGVLVWLIPLARLSGGLPAYLAQIRDHAAHVGRADSLGGVIATSGSLFAAIRTRGLALADTLLLALVGGALYPPAMPGDWGRFLALTAVVAPGLLHANWRARETRHLGIWLAAVMTQVFFIETLDRPRLLLPLVPPLALLVASGWARIRMPALLRSAMLSLIPLALLLQSLPQAANLSQVPAPPSQAAAYIRSHYPPGETLVAAAGTFRVAQVDLNDYPLAYLYRFDPADVNARFEGGVHYVAVLDRDQFTPDAMDILTRQGDWVTLEDVTFSRDRRIHTQHDQVRLQILVPPEQVPASALRLPVGGCIDLGGDLDGRYLGQGWYRPEEIGGVEGRWGGQVLTSTFRLSPAASQDLVLSMRALAFPEGQRLTVTVNGTRIGSLDQPRAWTEMRIIVPAAVWTTDQPATVELAHAVLASPATTPRSGSSDTRQLSTAYDWLCLTPGGAPTP